jgi:hypothetical protein
MFGFARRTGITDQKMWTLTIRVAVKMTAGEDFLKEAVGIQNPENFLTPNVNICVCDPLQDNGAISMRLLML